MILERNRLYYLTVIIIFLVLKYAYTVADNNHLLFLLLPTNYLVEASTNSIAVYNPSDGFFHHSLNIVIDKSCSGFNFLILCFAISAIASVRFLKTNLSKIINLPFLFLISYALTIFVNTSRINIALIVQNPIFSSINQRTWFHQAEGAFVYLSFLILFYFVIYFSYSKLIPHHAKPAQS